MDDLVATSLVAIDGTLDDIDRWAVALRKAEGRPPDHPVVLMVTAEQRARILQEVTDRWGVAAAELRRRHIKVSVA